MSVSEMGGGGCPGTQEILLPDLPFDFLQPAMTKGVTQAGYGGPFVIRGNPIGAIIDAIRGFCFPMPMQQVSSEGGVYDSGSYGSYGTDTGSLAGGYPGYGYSPYYGDPATNCEMMGTGYTYNPTTGVCSGPASATPTPTPSTTMGSCDYSQSYVIAGVLAPACLGDKTCLCNLASRASNCAQVATVPGEIQGWNHLATNLNRQAGVNCNVAPYNGSGATGGTGTGTGTTGGTGTGTGTTGGTTTCPAGSIPATPTPAGAMYMNPCPADHPYLIGQCCYPNPVAAAIQSLQKPRSTMPAMPNVPDPGSLTEGNISFTPYNEPLGGSFDPSRFYPVGTIRLR